MSLSARDFALCRNVAESVVEETETLKKSSLKLVHSVDKLKLSLNKLKQDNAVLIDRVAKLKQSIAVNALQRDESEKEFHTKYPIIPTITKIKIFFITGFLRNALPLEKRN